MAEHVNIHEAKTHLSRLLERVEAGDEIVIARNGRPIARLVGLGTPDRRGVRGSLRGAIRISPDFDAADADLERDFGMR
jgi:prevent-host-death family protein